MPITRTITVIFLVTLLAFTGNRVEGGMHRRREGLADLFAGGLLTLLFTEIASGSGQGIGSFRSLLGLENSGSSDGQVAYNAPPAVPHFLPHLRYGGMGHVHPMLGFGQGLNMLAYGMPPHMLPFSNPYNFGMYGQGRNFGNLGSGIEGFGHGFNFGPVFGLNGLWNGLGGFGSQGLMQAPAMGEFFKGFPEVPMAGNPLQERNPIQDIAIPNMNSEMPNLQPIQKQEQDPSDRTSDSLNI